jgi:hypothetical protein
VTERFRANSSYHDLTPLMTHWRQAERATSNAEDRARSALLVAQIATEASRPSYDELEPLWEEAVAAAKGTQWETVAQAHAFYFHAIAARTLGSPAGDPVDLTPKLKTLETLSVALKLHAIEPPFDEALKLLEKLKKRWTSPVLKIDAPSVVSPGEPFHYRVAAANCGELTAEIYRFQLEDLRGRPAEQTELRRAGIDPETIDDPGAALNGELVSTTALGATSGLAWFQRDLEAARLTPGFYSLVVRAPSSPLHRRIAHFLVSNTQVALIQGARDQSILHVYSRDSFSPRVGVKLVGLTLPRDLGVWTALTDAQGVARVSVGHLSGDVLYGMKAELAVAVTDDAVNTLERETRWALPSPWERRRKERKSSHA